MRGKALMLGAWVLVATFGVAGLAPLASLAPPSAAAAAAPGAFALPLAFEPNLGQAAEGRYVVRGAGYAAFLGPDGIAFDLAAGDEVARVRMTFPGAAPATLVPGEAAAGVSSYYIGDDAAAWLHGVPRFARVTLQGLWPGIDLVFYGNEQRQLEYDLVLAPGADPSLVRLAFEGAVPTLTASGTLNLASPSGALEHQAPIAYQDAPSGRTPVASRLVLHPDGSVGFALGAFDASKTLVIDPILLYSQTIGGAGYDASSDIAIDSFGNAYLLGHTTSLNLNFTKDGVDTAWQPVRAGFTDIFVVKFDAFGVFQWGTYLGGSQNNSWYSDGTERGAITVDPLGNVYAATAAHYFDFPMKGQSFQPNNAGSWDAVLVKLSAAGQLVQSTWFGSAGAEWPTGIGRDAAGNIYVAGISNAGQLPTTPGALQATRSGTSGNYDGWVAKFDPTLTQLLYCTYYGGSNGHESLKDLSVDAAGNAYIAGGTGSTDLPRTNAWQPSKSFYEDAFLAKLAPDGKSVVYATYYGAASTDSAYAVANDAAGNAYIAGTTDSTGLAIRGAAAQPLNAGGQSEAFLAKFSASGTLVYSTYLGGALADVASAVGVDAKERAVVTGWTNSWNFPTKAGPNDWYRAANDTIYYDTFLTRIDTKATTQAAALVYSTYFGTVGYHDYGNAIIVDGPGNFYVAGEFAGGFPIANNTMPPPKPGGAGSWNAYIAAFIDTCLNLPVTTASVAALAGGAGWWRSNAMVTLTATSLSCPVPFTFWWLDGGNMSQGRLVPINGDGSHTLVYRSRDLLGGNELNKTTIVKIDTTPPVTTPVISGSPGVGCWYRSQVTVTLGATDANGPRAVSGVSPTGTWYSLNNATWVNGKTLSISASGYHDLRYYTFDVAGNQEAVKTTRICLDYVPPTVDMTRPTNASIYVLDIEDPLRGGLPLTAVAGTLTVTADAGDDFSGVHRVELWVDGEVRGVDFDKPYAFTWEAGKETLGEHVVKAVAFDRAGNANESALSVITVPTRHEGALATLGEFAPPLPTLPPLPAVPLAAPAPGSAAAPQEVS